MLSYCLKCRQKTKSISLVKAKTSNVGTIILTKCAVCNTKKSRFIKKQQAKGLLTILVIRTPLSKTPLLGDVLF